MKRTAALLLMIVYMAFTLSAMGYSHGNVMHSLAVSHAAAVCNDTDQQSSCDIHFEPTGEFKKAPKHHSSSGKVKVPRPGAVIIAVASWQFPDHDNIKPGINASAKWNHLSTAIYLKNRVLLI
jgi:hypothetical protein